MYVTTLVLIPIELQFKDGIVEMCASPTCSHLAVTSLARPNEDEVEVKLAVYTMPVEAWLSELPRVEAVSQISVTSQKVREDLQLTQGILNHSE